MSRMLPIVFLLLLLGFPACSVEGAKSGLLLWFNVVLPTLAPFAVCTQTVVALGGTDLLIRPSYPAIHALFGLSASGAYVLLCGLLCGYPLGARLCADFLASGRISRAEADYLLSICNHPSPMFLLGFVRGQLGAGAAPAFLLLCLYLPVLPLSFVSRRVCGFAAGRKREFVTAAQAGSPGREAPPLSLEEAFFSTAETMVLIGGYIMLFSIISAWIGRLPFLPPAAAACLTGAAEITTGVNKLCTVFPPGRATLPVIAAVAFGGFSGIFQTKSVIKNAGLSIRRYVFWKLCHTGLACMTVILLSALLPLR